LRIGLLRRIFGPNRDEVTGEWRKLHNEELNDLYCLPNIVADKIKNEMSKACSTNKREEWIIQGFGGKPVVKTPLGRPRRRWEDNIKMVLQEVGCGGMD
jgi:hypothetical protein